MEHKMSSRDQRPQISVAQVAGSALAAVSAAVVASFLGVGGTVGSAVYAHSFRRAGEKLGETRVLTVVARSRAGRGDPGPGDVPLIEPAADDADGGPIPAYAESGPPGTVEEEVIQEPPTRPRWMRWQTAVVLAIGAFVVAMLVVSVIELTIGGPISGGSGGTTVTKLVHPSSGKHTKKTPTPSTPTRPAVTPTSEPTTTAPTPTPTGTPTSTPTSTPTDPPTTAAPVATPNG
jgi:hypothetical protein